MNDKKLLDIKERVQNKALVFLSIKPRSVWEIETRLNYYLGSYKSITKSQKQEIFETILKHLNSLGLLNDNDYAESLVKEKINSKKPSSSYEIKKFLIKKKIPRNIIDVAMKKYSRDVEKENIKILAEKKWKTMKDTQTYTRKSKLIKYLVRKGYSYDLTSTVVEDLIDVK